MHIHGVLSVTLCDRRTLLRNEDLGTSTDSELPTAKELQILGRFQVMHFIQACFLFM